jgi:hypothetical protein
MSSNATSYRSAPGMSAALGFDELAADTKAVSGLAHAPFQHIAHPELAPDLLHINGLAFVDEARIAGDHEQPVDAREAGDDILDHPVGEILLARVAAHVLERQHGDRRFFGQREIRRGLFRCNRLRLRRGLCLRGNADGQRINPHRLGDILELGRAKIVDGKVDFRLHLAIGILGKADGAGLSDPFQSRGDIHAIAHQVAV